MRTFQQLKTLFNYTFRCNSYLNFKISKPTYHPSLLNEGLLPGVLTALGQSVSIRCQLLSDNLLLIIIGSIVDVDVLRKNPSPRV